MSIVLYNPTSETMQHGYDGVMYYFKPEQKLRSNDKMAKHLLHHLFDFGLCRLDYGDESREAEIAEAGRERCRQFKIREINKINEDNYLRSKTQRPPVKPSPQMIRWSEEVGEPLTSYAPKSKTEESARQERLFTENENLKAENKGLRQQMASLEDKLSLILDRMNLSGEADAKEQMKKEDSAAQKAEELNKLRDIFRTMKGPQMKAYAKEFPGEIQNWPPQIQEEFHEKWKRILDDPWPF